MFVQIDGNSLTYEQIHQVIYEGYSVKISDHALENIKRSRALVEDSITNNKVIYGVNTGFGKFSDTVISKEDLADLQINLIRSHACGLGEPFPIEVSQVMLLLRANALAKGYSGIRLETLQLLIDCLNQNIVPVIPSQGSLGASGDLAPLSHLALLLVGEGEAVFNGEKMSGAEALKLAGLQPIKLQAKEGLALINGTQAMTAVGVVAYMEAQKLADLSDGIASLTLEGLQGIVDAFTPESHSVRPYPEQKQVAERILSYLDGSQLTTTQGQIRVQDAYSLRCIPQVHGAIQQVLNYVKEKLSIEINSATDNPLIFCGQWKCYFWWKLSRTTYCFCDGLSWNCNGEVGNISERRIERLVNPQLSDLPAFLSPDPGLQSGLMITQYAAASLVSENKTLAHPSSVDSIPSSANQEDHVSMGTTAARHAYQIIQNSRRVLAIEAICAAQAADIRGVSKLAPETTKLYSRIRKSVPTITKDRIFSRDIEKLAADLKGVIKEVNYEMVR